MYFSSELKKMETNIFTDIGLILFPFYSYIKQEKIFLQMKCISEYSSSKRDVTFSN